MGVTSSFVCVAWGDSRDQIDPESQAAISWERRKNLLLIPTVPEQPAVDLQLATRLGFFHEARRLPNRHLPLGMSERVCEPQ